MASSNEQILNSLKIHKVPSFEVWEEQYGETDGIGENDVVIMSPESWRDTFSQSKKTYKVGLTSDCDIIPQLYSFTESFYYITLTEEYNNSTFVVNMPNSELLYIQLPLAPNKNSKDFGYQFKVIPETDCEIHIGANEEEDLQTDYIKLPNSDTLEAGVDFNREDGSVWVKEIRYEENPSGSEFTYSGYWYVEPNGSSNSDVPSPFYTFSVTIENGSIITDETSSSLIAVLQTGRILRLWDNTNKIYANLTYYSGYLYFTATLRVSSISSTYGIILFQYVFGGTYDKTFTMTTVY